MTEKKFAWCVPTTKLLISKYEGCEMLYNPQHSDYKNRNKRLEAYRTIANAVKTINGKCTVDDVKKKLNGLRSQYLAEKMKVVISLKSGADGDDVYKPTVYWYPLLKFLEKLNADESQSYLDPHNNSFQNSLNMDTTLQDKNSMAENTGISKAVLRPSSGAKNESTFQVPKKKKKIGTHDASLIQPANTTTEITEIVKDKPIPQHIQDPIESFGKFIVSELRGIQSASNDITVRQAKRKIQHVLMDTWDMIDSQAMPFSPTLSQASSSSSSSSSPWSTTPHPVTFHNLKNSSDRISTSPTPQQIEQNSFNMVNNSIYIDEIKSEDCTDEFDYD